MSCEIPPNGAKMLGIEERTGTLEEGKSADFFLLNKIVKDISNTLSIEKVFKEGKEPYHFR